MMNIFWTHGGPGFNARPETHLLKNRFIENNFDVHFWNHPSKQRGDDTEDNWQSYIDHLENDFLRYCAKCGPCTLVAHSFGAKVSLHLIDKYPELINSIVWISGNTYFLNTLKNIFRFIAQDYKAQGLFAKSQKLIDVLSMEESTHADFLEKIGLVLENENFNQYYWTNKVAMSSYYPFFTEEWAIDMNCFMGVVTSMPINIDPCQIDIPTLACYGKDEVVINNSFEQNVVKSLFKNHKIVTFDDCSHFLHIENLNEFLKLLSTFNSEINVKSTCIAIDN